tara:strand:- start:337 stop:555 length:219 start_codon:yes stop_codon:yes gene_type:complete
LTQVTLIKTLINYFLKKGIRNTRQAIKKNILPAKAQKLPTLETIKQSDETTKRIHPNRFIELFFIFHFFFNF